VEVVFLIVILADLDKKASVRLDYHLSGVAERGDLLMLVNTIPLPG
jgi:hypothetical protein